MNTELGYKMNWIINLRVFYSQFPFIRNRDLKNLSVQEHSLALEADGFYW